MKIIQISEKIHNHAPHLYELYCKNKRISIKRDLEYQLSRFLNKSKCNHIDRNSHTMTKTERHLISFLSASRFLNDKNYNV